MAPLISDQERIFINKFVYHFEPIERGDVVVFWYPLDRTKSFIKRVVGLPGDMVEIRARAGVHQRPGVRRSRMCRRNSWTCGIRAGARAHGRIFCDGRSPHQLERFADFRPGAGRFIYGKAVFAYWPWNHFGSISLSVNASAK